MTDSSKIGLAQKLLLNVCSAPKAQFGHIVRQALTCPFGTPQTPHSRGLRQPRLAWLRAAFRREQSENVYENKGSPWKSTTPGPSLAKEGNLSFPSSDEEGQVWWDFVQFLAEQSENVYENKGSPWKSTTPGPP